MIRRFFRAIRQIKLSVFTIPISKICILSSIIRMEENEFCLYNRIAEFGRNSIFFPHDFHVLLMKTAQKGRCSLSQVKQPALNREFRPHRMKWSTYMRRYGTLYFLLIIPIAFFLIFRYYPMSYVLLGFKKNNILVPPWQVPWAKNNGFDWFIKAFKDRGFQTSLRNTIFLNLLDLIIGMPMPILMALLLNELAFPKYKRVTQTVLYLPHFLSWVIISGITLRLFGTHDGIINKLLGTEIPFVSEEGHWRATYIFLGIWKECGWNTIIYLAALTGINPELYEAAEVDGASRLQKIWHITLPGIRSTIVVLLIMNLGHILGSEFDRPFTLSNKLVEGASKTISIFVYERGIMGQQYALSTAVGLFQSVVCVIFLLISNSLAKKFGERGIW